MIGNIQILRGYAALAVVVYHLGFTFGLPHGTDFKGVAIFFVISGFLMSGFADQSAGTFLVRRAIRIVPLYWAATLLTVHLFGGFAWHDWRDVLLSLMFVPHVDVRGNWQPTLGVGWTLVLEMWFYSLFAIALALFGRRAPFAVAIVLATLVMALQWSGLQGVWVIYLGNLYSLHFVLGILLYYLILKQPKKSDTSRHMWWWLPITTACGALFCLLGDVGGSAGAYLQMYGVPAFTVGVAVWLARVGVDTKNPWAMRFGDASYSIYLLHTIGIEWFRQNGIVLRESVVWSGAFMLALTVVGYVVFRTFEAPAKALLTTFLVKR